MQPKSNSPRSAASLKPGTCSRAQTLNIVWKPHCHHHHQKCKKKYASVKKIYQCMRTSHNQNHTENVICSVPEKNICMNVCQHLSESYENMICSVPVLAQPSHSSACRLQQPGTCIWFLVTFFVLWNSWWMHEHIKVLLRETTTRIFLLPPSSPDPCLTFHRKSPLTSQM